jgi:23S rRNA pseudouridine2605 synthase
MIEKEEQQQDPQDKLAGERLQKVLAQAGVGSRREMEEWISAGRVTVNGEVATLGMRVVEDDVVRVDQRIIRLKAQNESIPRVLLYHKQEGEIVSRDDPEKRANVFDKLPKVRGMKWIAIGRLDFNTSGLLIFTSSGDLANRLMHPRFEVEREYAVRVQGSMTEEQMKQMLKEGIMLDDGPVKFEKLLDEGGEGYNHWYRLIMKEGRNRVVRRTFEALGLPVSRLMRVRFGIVNLPPRLKRGMLVELGAGEVNAILDWVGMETHVAPQLSPREAATNSGRGKLTKPHHTDKSRPTEKSKSTGKHGDKTGSDHHKGGRQNTLSPTPRGKADARRSAPRSKAKTAH